MQIWLKCPCLIGHRGDHGLNMAQFDWADWADYTRTEEGATGAEPIPGRHGVPMDIISKARVRQHLSFSSLFFFFFFFNQLNIVGLVAEPSQLHPIITPKKLGFGSNLFNLL